MRVVTVSCLVVGLVVLPAVAARHASEVQTGYRDVISAATIFGCDAITIELILSEARPPESQALLTSTACGS